MLIVLITYKWISVNPKSNEVRCDESLDCLCNRLWQYEEDGGGSSFWRDLGSRCSS